MPQKNHAVWTPFDQTMPGTRRKEMRKIVTEETCGGAQARRKRRKRLTEMVVECRERPTDTATDQMPRNA